MFVRSNSSVHIRPLNHLIPSILPLLAGVLLAGVAFHAVGEARAQTQVDSSVSEALEEATSFAPTSALGITATTWRTHFGEQTAQVLGTERPTIQHRAIRNLFRAAVTGERGIDLSAAVTPLLQIAKSGATEERRLMAIQALGAIGTEHSADPVYQRAMKKLYQAAQEEPPGRVRRAAAAVLKDFYGGDE